MALLPNNTGHFDLVNRINAGGGIGGSSGPAGALTQAQVDGLIAGSARTATLIIAASDSVNKAGADLVCSGAADQVAIMAAINSLSPTLGAKVLFRNGTYVLTAEITVDRSHITLEGESYGFWNRYVAASGDFTFPRSASGTPGGALFKQTVSGKGVWLVGNTFLNGGNRQQNINWRGLSHDCAFAAGTVWVDPLASDICRIEGCYVRGFLNAINVNWDNPIICNNNIQDTGGNIPEDTPGLIGAIIVGGYHAQIYGNVIFQVGGQGIRCGAMGSMIFGNIIGLPNANGILITTSGVKVTGNNISGIGRTGANALNLAVDGIVIGNYQAPNLFKSRPFGNVITGNTISMIIDDAQRIAANNGSGSGCGIRVGSNGGDSGLSNANYTVINGNYISNVGNGTSTGSAVALQNGSDFCAVTGNVFRWDAGTTKFVPGTGTNNQIGMNVGTT